MHTWATTPYSVYINDPENVQDNQDNADQNRPQKALITLRIMKNTLCIHEDNILDPERGEYEKFYPPEVRDTV